MTLVYTRRLANRQPQWQKGSLKDEIKAAAPGSGHGEFKAVAGKTLAAALREQMPDKSWRQVRELCASGKVTVNGERVVEPAHRLAGGEDIA
jgi:23S rRNA-/tRNA-specific pseudouridylate synthase